MSEEYWKFITSNPWEGFVAFVTCILFVFAILLVIYLFIYMWNGFEFPKFKFFSSKSEKTKPVKKQPDSNKQNQKKVQESPEDRLHKINEDYAKRKHQLDLEKQLTDLRHWQETERQRKMREDEQKRKEAERQRKIREDEQKQQEAERQRKMQEDEQKQQEAERQRKMCEAEQKRQEAKRQRKENEAKQKKEALAEYWRSVFSEYGKFTEYNDVNDPDGAARKALAQKILQLSKSEFTRVELFKHYQQLLADYITPLPKDDKQISRKIEIFEEMFCELLNWVI